MKTIEKRRPIFNMLTVLLITFSILVAGNVNAQKYEFYTSNELELIDHQNMDYMKQIDKIVQNYPAFDYQYTFDDGELQNVTVTGVDNNLDKKRLEVVLFDLKSNKNALKGKQNSMGVFYDVDKKARFEGGEDAFENTIRSNLEYPEDAQNWGAEGTIYVKFVIDADGNIPFATTSEMINTSHEGYVNALAKQAIEAVKATSGSWLPGKVAGVEVASLAVVPITFQYELDPSLSSWIR